MKYPLSYPLPCFSFFPTTSLCLPEITAMPYLSSTIECPSWDGALTRLLPVFALLFRSSTPTLYLPENRQQVNVHSFLFLSLFPLKPATQTDHAFSLQFRFLLLQFCLFTFAIPPPHPYLDSSLYCIIAHVALGFTSASTPLIVFSLLPSVAG